MVIDALGSLRLLLMTAHSVEDGEAAANFDRV